MSKDVIERLEVPYPIAIVNDTLAEEPEAS